MNLQVPSGFGTTPMGDICKVEIGILVNGPKSLPLEISLFSFARVSAGNYVAETKCLDITCLLGPVYIKQTPSENP